jgi:hypothetical protein
VSLAIIFAVTVVLSYFKSAEHDAQHLVFFYLLPTAIVAMVYGSVLSMRPFSYTIRSTACMWRVRREVGELVLFAGTAVIGAKCTAEIARPAEKYRNHLKIVTDPSNRAAFKQIKID